MHVTDPLSVRIVGKLSTFVIMLGCFRYNRYKENRPAISERDRLDRDVGLDRDRLSRVDRSVDRLPEHRERDYSYYDSGHPPDYDQYDQYGPERSSRNRPPHRSSRYGQPPPPRKDYPPSMDQFYQQPEMCQSGTYPSHSNRYLLKLYRICRRIIDSMVVFGKMYMIFDTEMKLVVG